MEARSRLRVGVIATALVLSTAVAGQEQGASPMSRSGGFDPLANLRDRTAPPPAEEGDALAGLPDGDGAELVFAICTGCHDLSIVRQQRMSDARWDYTLHWMVEKQGMPELDPDTRQTILGYLQTHFSSER